MATLERVSGRPHAMLMEAATGISHYKWRNEPSDAQLKGYAVQIAQHQIATMEREFVACGVPSAQAPAMAQEWQANAPKSPAASMLYLLGRYDDASQYTKAELSRFDQTHFSILAQMERNRRGEDPSFDLCAALPPRYSQIPPIDRYRRQHTDSSHPHYHPLRKLLALRANMALSFLALLDHEMRALRRRERIKHPILSHSLFAILLTPAPAQLSKRNKNNDPIARLVDLTAALASFMRKGTWFPEPPSLQEMANLVELSGRYAGNGKRHVQGLRSGKKPLTQHKLRTFLATQIADLGVSEQEINRTIGTLICFLYAAHMLSLLMPDHPTAKGHLDRSGWREAYLQWWDYHRSALEPDYSDAETSCLKLTDQPPAWLVDPV